MSFEVNGKKYSLQKEITFGKYRSINKINSDMSKIFKSNNPLEIAEAGNEQLQLVSDFLGEYVGITQEEMDNMKLEEAVEIFQKAFEMGITPNKELKKTSVSQ